MKPKPGIFGWLKKDSSDNVEEIMTMVNESHEQGVIQANEAEMITNIFELGEKDAKDIMTHRKNIDAVDGNMTLNEAVKFVLEQNNSRFPVYVDDFDNIVGILYLKDTMIIREKHEYDEWKIKDIPDLLREAHFIPETKNISSLFKEMQSKKIHMGIVVDEYGQTSGLITMEDILEEIVGNIFDEYDEEENNIVYVGNNTYNIKGYTAIEDIEDELGIKFTNEDDYDTISGLLISKIERIPQEDEHPEIELDGYNFKVLKVEEKMISVVRMTFPGKSDSDEK